VAHQPVLRFESRLNGKTYCKWIGLLEDIDQFDPLFFNISPKQAELMDPQHRLALQTSWQCIEDSGYDPSSLSDSECGVFLGGANSDYMYDRNRIDEADSQAILEWIILF